MENRIIVTLLIISTLISCKHLPEPPEAKPLVVEGRLFVTGTNIGLRKIDLYIVNEDKILRRVTTDDEGYYRIELDDPIGYSGLWIDYGDIGELWAKHWLDANGMPVKMRTLPEYGGHFVINIEFIAPAYIVVNMKNSKRYDNYDLGYLSTVSYFTGTKAVYFNEHSGDIADQKFKLSGNTEEHFNLVYSVKRLNKSGMEYDSVLLTETIPVKVGAWETDTINIAY